MEEYKYILMKQVEGEGGEPISVHDTDLEVENIIQDHCETKKDYKRQ